MTPKGLTFDPKAHSERSTASRPPLHGRPVRQADAPAIFAADGQPPWPLHGAQGLGDARGRPCTRSPEAPPHAESSTHQCANQCCGPGGDSLFANTPPPNNRPTGDRRAVSVTSSMGMTPLTLDHWGKSGKDAGGPASAPAPPDGAFGDRQRNARPRSQSSVSKFRAAHPAIAHRRCADRHIASALPQPPGFRLINLLDSLPPGKSWSPRRRSLQRERAARSFWLCGAAVRIRPGSPA